MKNWLRFGIVLMMFGAVFYNAATALAVCCRCVGSEGTANTCIETGQDCASLVSLSTNPDIKSLQNCATDPTCKPVSQGGLCATAAVQELTYKKTTTTASGESQYKANPVTPPVLGVAIPGLSFPSEIFEKEGYLEIPFFAQYVAAIYKYLIGISAVAAAVMIVWGGFRYIWGSTMDDVKKGKTIITDATIGLILVMGAYAILNTLNPALLNLTPLKVSLVKPEVNSYMSGRLDAPGTLNESGIEPGGGGAKTDLTIPAVSEACLGRNPSYVEPGDAKFANLGGQKVLKKNYTLCSNGRCLDQKTIDFYMKEQDRTGVPAAVIMAQIVTEAGVAAVFNLAEGGASSIYYNYGGIGCTQRQVPSDACAHVAFGPTAFEFASKKPHPVPCTAHNSSKELTSTCVTICEQQSRDTYINCGDGCYPQKSHASYMDNGVEVWIPSVQCSRKFKSPQEFLDAHLGFVRQCLAYNDSVYKFSYCIGASTYAGVTGAKGIALAEIIERNCLCDPAKDSLGCVRNKELEQNLAKNIIKKRNLYDRRFYKNGQPDFEAITQALLESTNGLLKPGELLPQNDIIPTP